MDSQLPSTPVSPTPAPPRPGSSHWPSIWQLGLSLFGIFSLWSTAAALLVLGLIQNFNPRLSAITSGLPVLMVSAGLALGGALLLPSAAYALARLLGRGMPAPPRAARFLRPTLLIMALPAVLLVGHWASQSQTFGWLLLPPLHVLAVGLPVAWLAYVGARNLPLHSAQRAWGVFGSGLVLGPGLILFLELGALALIFAAIVGIVASRPELANQITRFAQHLSIRGSSTEALEKLLKPVLLQPIVIYGVFAFGAGIVPLIEELLKPIGVWLLAGARPSPAQGFAAGVLCGAGYALFESMTLASNPQGWAGLVFARIGTGVIHVYTTGLTGWALSLAWREGRYLRLGAAYLTAGLIHSLWNTLALLASFSQLAGPQVDEPGLALLQRAGSVAPYALVVMALLMLTGLLRSNRFLHREVRDGLSTDSLEPHVV